MVVTPPLYDSYSYHLSENKTQKHNRPSLQTGLAVTVQHTGKIPNSTPPSIILFSSLPWCSLHTADFPQFISYNLTLGVAVLQLTLVLLATQRRRASCVRDHFKSRLICIKERTDIAKGARFVTTLCFGSVPARLLN